MEAVTENREQAKCRQDGKQDKGTKEEGKKKNSTRGELRMLSLCHIIQCIFKVLNYQIKN